MHESRSDCQRLYAQMPMIQHQPHFSIQLALVIRALMKLLEGVLQKNYMASQCLMHKVFHAFG